MSPAETGAQPGVVPKMFLSRVGKAALATLSVVLAIALLFQSRMWLPAARGMPVAADVWQPDHAQNRVAVEGNEKAGRVEEVLATVSRRLPADEICDCFLPDGTLTHSLITRDDAAIPAQNISSDVTVGGSLVDGAPGSPKTFAGKVTLGATVLTGVWNIANGLETGVPLSQEFYWYDFEMLAFSLMQEEYEGDFRVIVRDTGGTFTQTDFGFGDALVGNGTHTLVVFKTGEEIVLDRSPDGREFGPSVLAPFSKVTLMRNAGFIDGFLVARELASANEGGDPELQMRGRGYAGPLTCPCSFLAPRR